MPITDLFTYKDTVTKIQKRLPELFYIAELECSRAGKVGMEVGSTREKIIIALLIYRFGKENIRSDISITEPEIDVIAFNYPISIKSITGNKLLGVKLIWTVDPEQAYRFSQIYSPHCDILLVQVNWNNIGGLFYFTRAAQIETLNSIGRERYIKLPKVGTNPRGVEISAYALYILVNHPTTFKIPINWIREKIDYDPYDRWIDLWSKE